MFGLEELGRDGLGSSQILKLQCVRFPGEAGSRMDVSGLMGQMGTGSRPVGS